MARIQVANGRQIAYDDVGDGPPLLMFVGFMACRQMWFRQAPVLSRHLRLITLDNRDAGESGPETAPYTVTDMADDGVRLLDALGIERAHVLGHSMGGFIALQFALNHPERVDHLVLVGTSPGRRRDPGTPPTPPARDSWIEDPVERNRERYARIAGSGYFAAHPDELEAVAEANRGNRLTYEGSVRQSFATQSSHDVRDRLGEIAAPTLVIHGEVDPLIGIDSGRLLAERIPDARLLVMPGVGHLPHLERAEGFNGAVIDFLVTGSGRAG
ncbi:MAG TPA: alpha/beta hydrolase [Thermomicrobiaceae bacterium]|nr:alpha/beta hydrolase [Thermomicrobiaceae bacterium]